MDEISQWLAEQGKTITGSVVPDVGCHVLDIKRLLRQEKEAVEAADAILVLSCGAGVQAATATAGRPVLPGCNTLFLGNTERKGHLYEWCSACGECVIQDYGGICPITRCPKGQVNGPCGGTDQGKCEVDPEHECVWTQIYSRFDAIPGREKVEDTLFAAKNFQLARKGRRRVFDVRRGG